VINQLRSTLLAQEDMQLLDIALPSLLSACGLLESVFLRDERKLASQYHNALIVVQVMKELIIETVCEIVTLITVGLEKINRVTLKLCHLT
jgi:hypothetical protein